MQGRLRIAHITNLLHEDEPAFVHAVALGASGEATLVSLHADRLGASQHPPSAGTLLRRWNRANPGGEHRWQLIASSEDPAEALLAALQELQPDLLVATTRARTGLARLFASSIAETLARNLCVPVLILPAGCPGFVNAATGQIHLNTLLVAGGSPEDAQHGVDAAAALCKLGGAQHARCVLLHVPNEHASPVPLMPENLTLVRRIARGAVAAAIIVCAREVDADAIVMVSRGHDSLIDVLAESRTERVLHGARRPLLWVPASAAIAPGETQRHG